MFHYQKNVTIPEKKGKVEDKKKLNLKLEKQATNKLHSLPHEEKMIITIAEKIDMGVCIEQMPEEASALKRDELQKEEKESQQPATADSERMIDEPSTSQQAEMASEQQQQR
uniref:Uncharacterized protein n=1 Tax=Romanomermis culicivorax TaxID=13658 RepID=A0A915KTB3_ROMCU